MKLFGDKYFDFACKYLKNEDKEPLWSAQFAGTLEAINYDIPDSIEDIFQYVRDHEEWKVYGLRKRGEYDYKYKCYMQEKLVINKMTEVEENELLKRAHKLREQFSSFDKNGCVVFLKI